LADTALVSVIIWRILLVVSIVLVLYEMIKWFRTRTAILEPWVDTVRIKPPPEELEALTTSIQSSYGNMAVYSELRQRVNDDITDMVALTLGLDLDELQKLVLDDEFVKKTFGPYSILVSHLRRNRMTDTQPSTTSRRELTAKSKMEAFFYDINLLLDQVKRWEKYESQRSIRNR
jgi:hypothetical protein